jgi:hypothetical protein
MSETEKLIVGALMTILLIFTPGFVLHEAPLFPGSLPGSILGIAGAALMLSALFYPLIKYLCWLRHRLTRHVSMRAVLSFHVYAGVLGAVFGILHTGHKFESPLGIILVSSMLVVVLSGFIGRYYMVHLTVELRDQKAMLDTLRAQYDHVATELAEAPGVRGAFGLLGLPMTRFASVRAGPELPPAQSGIPLATLVNAIADLEYAMRSREAIKRAFARWIVVHVGAAIVMYAALRLHVWNGVYYGLRWLR